MTTIQSDESNEINEAALDALMAQLEAEDREARVVVRVDDAQSPKRATFERELPLEVSAQIIADLASQLARVSPEGAEVIKRTAEQIGFLHGDDAAVTRLRAEHARALDAAMYVSGQHAERIALAEAGIRDAARPLYGAARLSKDDVAKAERLALSLFRKRFPIITRERMSDGSVLGVLNEMARPMAPRKDSARGNAALKRIREENQRRQAENQRRQAAKLPKLPKLRTISISERARVCMPVFALLNLRAPGGGDEIEAIRDGLDDGWRVREDHFDVTIRDRSSVKKPSGLTETPSVDSPTTNRHAALHGDNPTRKAASRS